MSELDPLQFINIGPHGTFKESGKLHTTPANVDALFAHLKQHQITRLALHFHGGLVKEKHGQEIARSMNALYRQANSHPISVIWETGFMETVIGNLTELYQTELVKKLIKFLVRQIAKKLNIDVGGKGPGVPMTDAEIETELDKEDSFVELDEQARQGAEQITQPMLDDMLAEIEVGLEEEITADDELETLLKQEAPQIELLDEKFVKEVREEEAKGGIPASVLLGALVKVAGQVIGRYLKKRDHGFYPTIMEEIVRALFLADFGKWVWGNMKELAADMWKPNSGPIGESSYAGTYFLAKLAELQQETPYLIVDMVGHSAGSIAVCNMLAAAAQRHPAFHARNVLFLAPACTMDLFYDQIVTHPNRYQAFRMFTMQDHYEKQDRLVPFVYTHSLLYFVSGALEDEVDKPLAGMERYMSGQPPYDDAKLQAVRQFLRATGEQRLVLSKTQGAAPGLGSLALQHGAFDNEDLTRASLQHIIAQ